MQPPYDKLGVSILKAFSRLEASLHLNDIGYAAALTTGCEQKGLCEPSEIPLRQELRCAPKRAILSAKASRIVQGHISVA